MNGLSDAVDQLSHRLEALEHRVSALEHPGIAPPASLPPLAASVASQTDRAIKPAEPARIFSILGQCMLAVAGAYLLRALAESSAVPRMPVVGLAILYSLFWLIPATRAQSRRSAVAWSATSALILLPMLWELTVRQSFLPASVTAAVLCAFVILAAALAWNRYFAEVFWVVESAAALAAVALALATRAFIPFVAALLLTALAGEIAAASHRALNARVLVALAVDFAIFGLLWIYAGPATSGADYPGVRPGLVPGFAAGLLFLYASSATVGTLVLRRRISFFETAQTLVAFALAFWGVVAFAPGPGVRWFGAFCLAAAAGGYVLAFARFRSERQPRNFHVYATGSLALLLAGCALSLPADWPALLTSLFAVTATVLSVRSRARSLEFHGVTCLLAAAVSSGLLVWIGHAFAGGIPLAPRSIVPFASAAAIACYAILAPRGDNTLWPRILRLIAATVAVAAVASLAVFVLIRVVALIATPGLVHLAVVRTLAGCGLAAFLAWGGPSWRLREMVWLTWAVLFFLTVKLLFEDLRHGHLGFAALSIFAYAVTLLAVPKLLRPKAEESPHDPI